jgi:3',5'-cyclic AMP phosphodiesterase CpdA
MPIHLPPISRRKFLAGSLATGAGLMASSWLRSAEIGATLDPNRVALLSDTHIDANVAKLGREINMADHLRQACAEVVKLDPLPGNLLVNGDFAFNSGEAGDYATAVELIKPVREAGVPVHIGLGNHDNRERFWAGLKDEHKPDAPMKEKHVAVIDTPRARWILLDSLNETLEVRGHCGEQQLKWLAETLDADKSKPALVMVHHNPEIGDAAGKKGGLADTEALLSLLSARKQAKALFYGHSHRWTHDRRDDGLHLVNLPANAYVFAPEQPSAWVDTRVEDSGATLELRCLDPKHPWSGQKVTLEWRNA